MPKSCLWLLGAALLQTAAQGGQLLITLTNQVWRYDQSGVDPGAFQLPEFDDSAWPQGRSILAYEDSTNSSAVVANILPYTNTVLIPPVAGGPTVVYFRTHFNFNGDANLTVLTASNLVDDGYIMYLNGVEAGAYNMNSTRTLAAQTGPQGEGIYIVKNLCYPPGTLRNGDNVLAVAVYQNANTSSDVVWGTVLHTSPGSAPVVVSPTAPVNIALKQGLSTNLSATVQAAPCATYQWYFDPPGPEPGAPISGATATSYTLANMDQSKAGGYFLRSMNGAGSTDSASFNVSFNQDFTQPMVRAATANPMDLSRITLTFSEDVIDMTDTPFDPYVFYLEEINDPNNVIAVAEAGYGSASNLVALTLYSPRDPTINYQLVISIHRIEDRFGNRLADPTIVRVTVPIVFQNGTGGYVGTQDTQLEQASPNISHGNDATLICDGSPLNHGLLRFDNVIGGNLGQVPPGAFVNQATLRMYTDDPTDRGTPVRMLRMRAPWSESSTWNSMGNGIDETNGVETGATDGLVVADIDNSFLEIDVTAAVQAWAYSETNYGWAFIPTGPNGWTWASSENAISERRPALLVDYFIERYCAIEVQPQSVTVAAGNPAALTVIARGSYLRYQWYKFRTGPRIADPLPGATNSTYQISRSRTGDSGDYYVVVRSFDDTLTCTSQVVRLTVLCDDTPVRLLSAVGNVDQTTISLIFDKPLDLASAQNTNNYAISGGLGVRSATVVSNQVTLTTSDRRVVGLNYTLTVSNVQDDACFNRIFPNPTVVALTQDVRILSFDAVWKYYNEGSDLGTQWRRATYDDSGWPQGPALLGFESTAATLTTLSNQNLFVRTMLRRADPNTGQPYITDYFRALVNVWFGTSGVTYTLRHIVDDGAVFYFNGAEVARFNMPTGTIDYATVARSPLPEEGVVGEIPNLTGLVCGLNSVAVEVHQQTPVSNDVLLGAELIARVPMFMAADCFPFIRVALDQGGQVILYWNGPMLILQEAETLGGQWRDVPEATSPWRVTPVSGTRFYRLR